MLFTYMWLYNKLCNLNIAVNIYIIYTCMTKNTIINQRSCTLVYVDILQSILVVTNLQYCGHTALTFACLKGDLTSISALLKLGANPNVCTQVCI